MYRLGDVEFMREALRLAAEGTALTSPNPRVGAVVVRDGEIAGRGWHRYEERTHAEVVALEQAGAAAAGATLYVNLEPCCHTGRTPPCTAAIQAAGIARVVAAMADPNPLVAGGGLRALAEAGIAVECGCLEREAQRLNEDFAHWVRTGRPLVTLKAAVSLDGRIGAPGGGTVVISSQAARERVQQMRHGADAILTGIGTALADDPLLTDRTKLPRRRPLLRVVLDTHLRLPLESRLVKTARRHHDLLVFHASADTDRQRALEKAGVRLALVAADAAGRVDAAEALRRLGEEQILSVLLEAGAAVNASLLEAGLVDKLAMFQAAKLLGGDAVPLAAGWKHLPRTPRGPLTCESVGPDVLLEAYLEADAAAAAESGNNACSQALSKP